MPSRESEYLVCYDISHPRRLRRVARVCKDYGVRVQKSVFRCRLSAAGFRRLWQRIQREMDVREDSVIAVPLCGACVSRLRCGGRAEWDGEPIAYIY